MNWFQSKIGGETPNDNWGVALDSRIKFSESFVNKFNREHDKPIEWQNFYNDYLRKFDEKPSYSSSSFKNVYTPLGAGVAWGTFQIIAQDFQKCYGLKVSYADLADNHQEIPSDLLKSLIGEAKPSSNDSNRITQAILICFVFVCLGLYWATNWKSNNAFQATVFKNLRYVSELSQSTNLVNLDTAWCKDAINNIETQLPNRDKNETLKRLSQVESYLTTLSEINEKSVVFLGSAADLKKLPKSNDCFYSHIAFLRGIIELERTNPDTAEQDLQRALDLNEDPEFELTISCELARCDIQQNSISQAIEILDEVIEKARDAYSPQTRVLQTALLYRSIANQKQGKLGLSGDDLISIFNGLEESDGYLYSIYPSFVSRHICDVLIDLKDSFQFPELSKAKARLISDLYSYGSWAEENSDEHAIQQFVISASSIMSAELAIQKVDSEGLLIKADEFANSDLHGAFVSQGAKQNLAVLKDSLASYKNDDLIEKLSAGLQMCVSQLKKETLTQIEKSYFALRILAIAFTIAEERMDRKISLPADNLSYIKQTESYLVKISTLPMAEEATVDALKRRVKDLATRTTLSTELKASLVNASTAIEQKAFEYTKTIIDDE